MKRKTSGFMSKLFGYGDYYEQDIMDDYIEYDDGEDFE